MVNCALPTEIKTPPSEVRRVRLVGGRPLDLDHVRARGLGVDVGEGPGGEGAAGCVEAELLLLRRLAGCRGGWHG